MILAINCLHAIIYTRFALTFNLLIHASCPPPGGGVKNTARDSLRTNDILIYDQICPPRPVRDKVFKSFIWDMLEASSPSGLVFEEVDEDWRRPPYGVAIKCIRLDFGLWIGHHFVFRYVLGVMPQIWFVRFTFAVFSYVPDAKTTYIIIHKVCIKAYS